MDYEVVRKDIRNMYLRVKPPDGRVVVSAPRFMPTSTIERFVRSRASWIEQQRARLRARPDAVVEHPESARSVMLWGKRYELVTFEDSRYGLSIEGDRARFTVRRSATAEAVRSHWRECLRERFMDEVRRRAPVWEAHTGLVAREWRSKFMSTRWGTCSIAARRIWLNVKLIHYPPACLDYVIVHELVHLRERSHGPAFQALMDRFYPNWRAVRRSLNG